MVVIIIIPVARKRNRVLKQPVLLLLGVNGAADSRRQSSYRDNSAGHPHLLGAR